MHLRLITARVTVVSTFSKSVKAIAGPSLATSWATTTSSSPFTTSAVTIISRLAVNLGGSSVAKSTVFLVLTPWGKITFSILSWSVRMIVVVRFIPQWFL